MSVRGDALAISILQARVRKVTSGLSSVITLNALVPFGAVLTWNRRGQ